MRARGADVLDTVACALRCLLLFVCFVLQEELLSNPRVVKLGFAFGQDAAALRKACPSMRGFRQILALLEVRAGAYGSYARRMPP